MTCPVNQTIIGMSISEFHTSKRNCITCTSLATVTVTMQPCWKTGGENTCVWHFNRQFATLEEANFEVCGYSVLWIEGKICRDSCGEWGEKWSIHYSKNALLMMSLGKAFTKDDCYSSHSMGDLPTHRWNSCCSLQLHGRVWYITSCIIMYIYHLQSHASNANRLGETCSHIAAVLSC